jgi:transposase-like protein
MPILPVANDPRELRGLALVKEGRPIRKEGKNKWHVPSQQDPTKTYLVTSYAQTGADRPPRWTCTCPDHAHRGMECKHIHAARFLEAARKSLQVLLPGETPRKPRKSAKAPLFHATPPEPAPEAQGVSCKHCGALGAVRNGYKSGKQEYRCRACGRAFVQNEGFARIKANPRAVCLALDLHFKGISLRQLADTLEQFFGLRVSHATVYRWLQRYVTLITEYASTLEPWVGDKWHADEVFTKFSGDLQYLWHVMDADTRYLLVSRVTKARGEKAAKLVMQEAARLADKAPNEIVTDGLIHYEPAVKKHLRGAKHTKEIHISKPDRYPQNNRVERLNGTVRARQKPARGLKSPTGPLTVGQQVYYNLVRPHMALDGRTPAEAAGVGVQRREGESRWNALVRDALRVPN